MKRGLSFLLAVLLVMTLCGCAGKGERTEEQSGLPEATGQPAQEPGPVTIPEPTAEPTPEFTPEPTPEPNRDLDWSKAFREEYLLSEGSVTPEVVAFFSDGEEIGPEIVNVPIADVLAWWAAQETLPRTHYFEQFMPEKLQDLYPILDYAFAHSYSRFCVPTTTFTATDVAGGWKYLPLTYRINNNGISTLTPASFDLGGGKTLQYVTVTLKGMDRQGVMQEYQESLAAAREIVAGIPEGSSEYDKALYLYRWLTENVHYYDGDYYESEWNLLYDTLVKRDTVCAGYAEALYVMYNLAGIECFTVLGAIYMDEEWGAHIWNVAKIEGEYYLFDATWDTGLPPERYQFFGVSENTMQSIYPRTYLGQPEEYCPPCTRDLPLPGEEERAKQAELAPGKVENGVYSQPFSDLQLLVDDSWKVWTRKEIAQGYYGLPYVDQYGVREMFNLNLPFCDLVLEGDGIVQVLLEPSPMRAVNGDICSTAEDYMEALTKSLPGLMQKQGLTDPQTERFQKEICSQRYEAIRVWGTAGPMTICQGMYCIQMDGCFLTIIFAGIGERADEIMLAKLLGEAD